MLGNLVWIFFKNCFIFDLVIDFLEVFNIKLRGVYVLSIMVKWFCIYVF